MNTQTRGEPGNPVIFVVCLSANFDCVVYICVFMCVCRCVYVKDDLECHSSSGAIYLGALNACVTRH